VIKKTKYPHIEDHGVILNNRTAALVSKYGEIDFACFPNFDSYMVFFSILDREKGGFFNISPSGIGFKSTQYYEPDTNILHTLFSNNGANVFEIVDFLPMTTESNVYFSEVHRRVETFSNVKLSIEFAPFLESSRKNIEKFSGKGFMAVSENSTQFLATDLPLNVEDGTVKGTVDLSASDIRWLVTSYNIKKAYSVGSFSSEQRLWQTRRYWKQWLLKSNYQGIFYDLVNRSLLTLKGLFFDPTGFMVAAPTTSLPESIGGIRNWDYRFMWIRDTIYVIDVLVRLGYIDEATKFYSTIIDKFERDGRLYSVYSVSGDSIVNESTLNISGYMDSRPVRIGNGAHEQLQIDQYASIIIGLRILLENNGMFSIHTLEKVLLVGEFLLKIWEQPDSSIWEIRGEKRQYVYSKVLAWKAFTDIAWLLSRMGIDDEASTFSAEAEKVRRQVYQKGVSEKGYFSQHYESEEVDSALLRIPLIGFCNQDDPVYVKTLEAIERKLMIEDFLFKRYTLDDGMESPDNAFLMITFWYIRNMIQSGKLDRSYSGIMKMTSMMNALGLLPEELEFGSHRYLGNYPQALSHLSLVTTIVEYNDALNNAAKR
jgi:glucoamylase